MRNMNGRLERIESRVQSHEGVPVLIAHSEEEIEERRAEIGPNTVIILDDISEMRRRMDDAGPKE